MSHEVSQSTRRQYLAMRFRSLREFVDDLHRRTRNAESLALANPKAAAEELRLILKALVDATRADADSIDGLLAEFLEDP